MLRKLMTGAVVLGAVLATGVFSQTAKAGTIGTIPNQVDQNHDLSAFLGTSDFMNTTSFDFEGSTDGGGSFSLIGSYDINAVPSGTVSGNFDAFGTEVMGDSVSYTNLTVEKMDLSQVTYNPQGRASGSVGFLIDPPLLQSVYVLVNIDALGADTSPIPSTAVPIPPSALGGGVLLGLVALGAYRRRSLVIC
jgi:hypothetical protein